MKRCNYCGGWDGKHAIDCDSLENEARSRKRGSSGCVARDQLRKDRKQELNGPFMDFFVRF